MTDNDGIAAALARYGISMAGRDLTMVAQLAQAWIESADRVGLRVAAFATPGVGPVTTFSHPLRRAVR